MKTRVTHHRWWQLSGAALLVALAAGSGGCANKIPMSPVLPAVAAPKPLPGEVAVMLPMDVRPRVERAGGQPGLEYFIYLVFAMVDSERGSYVTADTAFGPPPANKTDANRFPTKQVVAAAVGESVYSSVIQSGLFEHATRLSPSDAKPAWDLPDKAPAPVRISSTLPPNLKLSPNAEECENLQCRAAAAPLPPCSSQWLLRVRIVHLYGAQYATSVTVTASSGQNSTTSNTVNRLYTPVGNAVLECELYHVDGGTPVLVWDRSFVGSSTQMAGNAPSYTYLLVPALSDALNHMMAALVTDSPKIELWLKNRNAKALAVAFPRPQ